MGQPDLRTDFLFASGALERRRHINYCALRKAHQRESFIIGVRGMNQLMGAKSVAKQLRL